MQDEQKPKDSKMMFDFGDFFHSIWQTCNGLKSGILLG